MTNSEEFGRQIEQMVKQHLVECREVVTAAVERAFAACNVAPTRRARRAKAISGTGKRRTPEEIAALSEQLYAAICKTPGETLTLLAGQLETTPGALQVPLKRLKQAGRVRSAGQRQLTRYFPMLGTETELAAESEVVSKAAETASEAETKAA